MTREKAITRILSDLGIPVNYENYVVQTIGRLGCGKDIDISTIKAIEKVIKREAG